MKRILVTFLSISFFSIFYSVGQSNNFSRWSFTAEYVSTYFFGDMHPVFGGVIPSSIGKLNFGATAEYAFTPIWGLGIDYYHCRTKVFIKDYLGNTTVCILMSYENNSA